MARGIFKLYDGGEYHAKVRLATNRYKRVRLCSDADVSLTWKRLLQNALDRKSAGEPPKRDKLVGIPRRCLEVLGLVSRLAEARGASWGQHVADYVAELRAARHNAEYVANADRYLTIIGKACGWASLDDVSRDDLAKHLAKREKGGTAARTINNIRATAISFMRWAVDAQRADANPLESVKWIDETGDRRRERRGFRQDEAVQLLAVAGPRELCYWLGLGTALRRGELQGLQWRDVRIDGEDASRPFLQLRAEATKSKRADWVPLQRYLADRLRTARPPGFSPTARVLPGVPTHRAWLRDLERADLSYRDEEDGTILGFHSMRVTVRTTLLTAGRPEAEVDAIMRHRRHDVGAKSYTDLRTFGPSTCSRQSSPCRSILPAARLRTFA